MHAAQRMLCVCIKHLLHAAVAFTYVPVRLHIAMHSLTPPLQGVFLAVGKFKLCFGCTQQVIGIVCPKYKFIAYECTFSAQHSSPTYCPAV